jgi:hypothetical protein
MLITTMNNTKTLAIVAVVLTAATLVVGLTVAATMTTPAFAGGKTYSHGKYKARNGGGNENGNTLTALKCQNKGSASGFDTTTNQECENTICTHPGSNGTCVSESEGAVIISNNTNAALCPGGGFFNPSAGKCVGTGSSGT